MLKSIYTPLSGAIAQEKVLEIIANNLANSNTTAFKGDAVSFSLIESEPNKNYPNPVPPANYKISFEDLMPLRGNEIGYAGVAEVYRDTSQGPAMETGNGTDLMIEGEGWLNVQTPEGLRYTRNGSLSLSPEGVLMTAAGHPVLGAKGTINVRGGAFEVNQLGEIYQDGQLIDRLMVSRFESEAALERVGGNNFFFNGPPESVTQIDLPRVRQGYLEGSNVNPVKNLTAMILAHRSYEAYQKAISNYDRMLDKSANQLGEVRA